ncbi:hypothetical protein BO94DRAFT_178400 [Aspergillus sclerotioniger CBS 115572]|uniref:Uncharacterized protein n=1 Tax=Aspergillus sclerotioniger CBS 115572 TaxID=1450535 RepID=A0A317VYR5_9EURO|nr:hypothetical protein BO94DRAFT_178400 [Aspergillus sclerotioniger CBS 115572]PWY78471.1 hypothetical protein BO94DRAFT_178400 [Aspergillus sclerotioniger CBS 115572]
MAPTKPVLPPLSTPKNMTFPSEFRERTWTCLDIDRPIKEVKKEDQDEDENDNDVVTITPPPAYTEFLNTFSPIFACPANSRENFYKYMRDKPRPSPASPPLSATSITFSGGNVPKSTTTPAPVQASRASRPTKSPIHTQRMRLPPPYLYTPVSASPRSAHPLRSPFTPSDWRQQRFFDSPISETGNAFCVRHVTTTTVTYKRAPQLDPPPQGKRRKNASRRTT